MLLGESGTGKELFGNEKGAFTGAVARRIGRFFTIRFGGGALYDDDAYSQDEGSTQQFDLGPEGKSRDARVLLKGQLEFKRPQPPVSSGVSASGRT